QNRETMPVRTITSWIASAITRMARKPESSPFSAPRIRSTTGPRFNTDVPGSIDPGTCGSSATATAESVSGMPGFLQDRIVKIGADDVLELRVDALGRLQIIRAIDLDDVHALGLVTLRDFVALGSNRRPPVLGQVDAGGANGLLRVLGQRVEFRLARHHHTDIVDLIGQVDGVDDLVVLGGGQRDHRRL